MRQIFILMVVLALASPVFGQTADTPPPYDVTTAVGYREWAIRWTVALCKDPSVPSGLSFPPWLSPVDDLSDAKFIWEFVPRNAGFTLLTNCSRSFFICNTLPPYGDVVALATAIERPGLSCADYGLPPTGATVNRAALPDGYNQYGEPGAEPEPETPQEPVGNLEVPANGSFQSGIGYISGWVCNGRVEIVLSDYNYNDVQRLNSVPRWVYRGDTEAACGDMDNGFITQWNWNLLGEGQHTARLVVDGQTIQSNTFTVTTLGEEFIRGLERDVEVTDFPSTGETTRLRWQEAIQGFVLVPD